MSTQAPALPLGFSLQIDADAVQSAFVSAVLEAGIGDEIRKAVEAAIKKPQGYGQESVVEQAVRSAVHQLVLEIARPIVEAEFRPRVEALVREKLTDDAVTALTKRLLDKAYRDY